MAADCAVAAGGRTPGLIRFAAAVALVAAGMVWLLGALPLPLALLLAIPGDWMGSDLVQP